MRTKAGASDCEGEDAMNSAPTNVSDYDAIARTVQHYIDGATSGRGSEMKPVFHHDATIFGYVGADLFAGEPTARG
jgi:hypothetical protein